MRTTQTRAPSFPEVTPDVLLNPERGVRWQVLGGDAEHWRAGLYSPPEADPREVRELERHDCPELFLLVSGRVHLLLAKDGGLQDVALEPGQPLIVQAPHAGYCPDGPFSGVAFVVERDQFDTEYRPVAQWLQGQTRE